MNKYGLSYFTALALVIGLPALAQEIPAPEATAQTHLESAPPEIIAPPPTGTEDASPAPVKATSAPSRSGTLSADLIDENLLKHIHDKIDTELVFFMVNNQNEKYETVDEEKITLLDAQWVAERSAENKPMISAVLSNPLSTYLTAVQAHSEGLFTELFVMDNKGLNVGQSNISSDYWQGDEAKWQKTYSVGPEAVFIDEAEFDEDRKLWIVQVNIAIADPQTGKAIGAATIDVNLNELRRRNNENAKY